MKYKDFIYKLKSIIFKPFIPKGIYCYTIKNITYTPRPRIKTKMCPFYRTNTGRYHDKFNCGECLLFGMKDWKHGTLLWDGVKECGVNDDLTKDEKEFSDYYKNM